MKPDRPCICIRSAARFAGAAVLLSLTFACSSSGPSWQMLYNAGDPFSIEAPGTPKVENIDQNVPQLGGSVTGKQYSWETSSNHLYLAMYMSFPNPNGLALDMKGAMKNMVAGVVSRAKGSITSEKSLTMAGIEEGTETEIKMGTPQGTMRIRTAERNRTIYLLAFGWPEGREPVEDENRFFDSFHMK